MYKIYINQTPLLLTSAPMGKIETEKDNRLITRYSGKSKLLLNYVDMMEKGHRFEMVNLFFPDVEQLFQDFSSHYNIVEAAGGIVYNARQEMLLIHRLGYWDLPKGKIDEGELPEQAALREVREETGLKELFSDGFAAMTYHTYRDHKKRRALKPTHWFRMHTAEEELIPQTEENIEKAVWIHPNTFFPEPREVYCNIQDLIEVERHRIK